MTCAQSIWKENYSTFHYRYALPHARRKARLIMIDYRREAALERRIAALERQLEQAQSELNKRDEVIRGLAARLSEVVS